MKFVVTCLDGGGFRVLASKSKVFTSLPEAIKYGGTVSLERKAEVVPIIDAHGAAESVFTHLVEHHQDVVAKGDLELVKPLLRYEQTTGDEVTACFMEGCDPTGFSSSEISIYFDELISLVKGVKA